MGHSPDGSASVHGRPDKAGRGVHSLPLPGRLPVHLFPSYLARGLRDKHIPNHMLLEECNYDIGKISTCNYKVNTISLGEGCALRPTLWAEWAGSPLAHPSSRGHGHKVVGSPPPHPCLWAEPCGWRCITASHLPSISPDLGSIIQSNSLAVGSGSNTIK